MTTSANTDLAGAVERLEFHLTNGGCGFSDNDLRLILTALASKEEGRGSSGAESAARGPSDLMGSTAPGHLDWAQIARVIADAEADFEHGAAGPDDIKAQFIAKRVGHHCIALLAPSSQTEAAQPVHDAIKSDVPEDVGDDIVTPKLLRRINADQCRQIPGHVIGVAQRAADLITSLSRQEALNDHFVNRIQRALGDGPDGSDLEVLAGAVEGLRRQVAALTYDRDEWKSRAAERDAECERRFRAQHDAQADLAAMRERVERAEAALAFYRDEWTVPPIGPREDPQPSLRLSSDHGRRARSYFTQGGETS